VSISGLGRFGHTATTLLDGKILIVGGFNYLGQLLPSEIFDPVTRSFSNIGSPHKNRLQHAASLLQDGRVLISGGNQNDGINAPLESEIYDPSINHFSEVPELSFETGVSSTTLQDGRILLFNTSSNYPFESTSEIYNPISQQITQLSQKLPLVFANLLPNGSVFIQSWNPFSYPLPSTFNPESQQITSIANVKCTRADSASTVLPNGKILITAGEGFLPSGDFCGAIAELIDPSQNNSQLYDLPVYGEGSTLTLLSSGKVVAMGWSAGISDMSQGTTIVVFDPETGSIDRQIRISWRYEHTASLLPDGNILILGGLDGSTVIKTNQSLIFHPDTGALEEIEGL
jgi:hypothetical protein